MTPERYLRLERLWHQAADLPAAERAAFVRSATEGDEGLRRELESLLESAAREGGVLDQPADDLAAALLGQEDLVATHRTLGNYRLESKLGSGGMGEVYLAFDLRLGRRVALKVLPAALAAAGEPRRRLTLEAQAASTLSHPNVAHVYELAEVDGVLFIAMEYVPGQTLAALLQQRRLEALEAVELAVQIADALEEAHAKGLVHRDIKPLNLMLTPRGLVKVLDFGLARRSAGPPGDGRGLGQPGAPTDPGARMGTAGFMSPEQALGFPADARSDVYSFGATLAEMVGVRAANPGLAARAGELAPSPGATTTPPVPAALSRILGRCLDPDPSRRFPSGKELHAELRALATELRASAGLARGTPRPRRLAAGAAALATLGAVLAWAHWSRGGPELHAGAPSVAEPQPVRVAVLPFEALGDLDGRGYLADALTDETISALGKLEPERLSVLGRTSILAYQRTTKRLDQIGRELGATYLVENSIRSEKSRVRVISKLIRASDQVQLWSATYDSEPSSILAFQQELGTTLAEQVRLRLSPERMASLARRQTRNPQAFDLYLRGRYLWYQLTPATTQQAIEAFARATEVDPDYALAWSGLSDAYSASPMTGDAPALSVWPLARSAAAQAVRAEPELAEAQASLGFVKFWFDWDWPGAEAAFRKAISLDAGYAFAHRMLGLVLSHLARYPEARKALQRARELEPLYAMHHALSAQVACSGRDPAAAIDHARQAIVVDPQFWIGHFNLAQAYELAGDLPRALESAGEAERLSGGNSKALALRGYILARQGRPGEARELLKRLEVRALDRFVPPYAMALVHEGLGERDQALAWLERAVAARDVHLVLLTVDQKWDALRPDPRFRALLLRSGLPWFDPPP